MTTRHAPDKFAGDESDKGTAFPRRILNQKQRSKMLAKLYFDAEDFVHFQYYLEKTPQLGPDCPFNVV